jgi:hypothetical protein
MSHAKQVSKRKRRSKAVPMLGAAGLSLSLMSGASAAAGGSVAAVQTRNAGVGHEITLREEEISGVSLATFYVFDKEIAGTLRRGARLAAAGCGACGCGCGCGGFGGCWTGTNYTASVFGNDTNPPRHSINAARKHTPARKRGHAAKSE